jgi:hypothetical protein
MARDFLRLLARHARLPFGRPHILDHGERFLGPLFDVLAKRKLRIYLSLPSLTALWSHVSFFDLQIESKIRKKAIRL